MQWLPLKESANIGFVAAVSRFIFPEFPSELMTAYAVSPKINKASFNHNPRQSSQPSPRYNLALLAP
jgi:hypothetical protein